MKDIQRHGKEHGSLTDEKWQAIISNDASYNDKFFYAVKTTGIFCRPSCRSREPKKENVRIFLTAEEALSENFRPCKRCKPTGQRLPDVEWVAQITDYIKKNYSETLTLESLADICHGSPYHMHRTFKRIMGITPIEYIQQTRINKAMVYLIQSDKTIADIAMTVGMPNTPYFITLFKKVTGYTPKKFRQLNKNTQTMEVLQSGSKK
ncbi:bifunctional transcriptional activator/DNA repair enzyme AdaA [Brevibacillus laterosporus]|uniref:bifunctional transcriptional activator/DNA repair enzyme AdaA n=1 Tax=Brevibacillus laterosporus TaxID=1465 RepID=UPI00039B2091|nr:bifunctional transcriptional activator/DNA repair enzyme AdaA [Brevibacillus laterosporus]ATO52167.1 AraC family transcriptional regulator [Brevibacillus laterosporus DSM 25]MBG9801303.1 AraC family transcriptional regulator [Brevibacillus laterosporus]MED2002791.1 bifunctional transcriptional activator/DNA repair enzyme AdaA [Brevibacillus laterosporus]MED4765154.1 bifunctional transcriptional activator/DNA repair enzyme AdaA [Brevibacillus laterosporus]TPH12471.1 methylphosphotriester-DNA